VVRVEVGVGVGVLAVVRVGRLKPAASSRAVSQRISRR
jgi:hypothetical protein